MSDALINDPLFPSQWHLQNTGQTGGTPGIDLNVTPVWADYDGSGVVVGVVDDGVETGHPDIYANVNTALSYDYLHPDSGGQPVFSTERHGMAVAGIIAAMADNDLGGAGVAPGATIVAGRLMMGAEASAYDAADITAETAYAFIYAAEHYDVMNNSWGDVGFASFNEELNAALIEAVSQGRDGLGTVVVFAAGNERGEGGDSNTDPLVGSPYVIAVAAVDHDGNTASYSSPGANVLVAAPSVTIIDGVRLGGIVTTDRVGYAGYNAAPSPEGDSFGSFGGTSAAAPEVSGVAALMLEANPELGYRDVQDILALTARDVDADGDWAVNGASDWNGGGMRVGRDVGYGLVDALAAVRLAETWEEQNTYDNLVTASAATTVGAAIPEDGGAVVSSIFLADDVDIERVQVILDIDHELASDLTITLVAPSGTTSPLLDQAWPDRDESWPGAFSLTSTFHLGESSQGTWTLRVADARGNDVTGTLNSWEITVYGKEATEDSLYVYTNEFSDMAASDPGRTVLSDASGYDVMNLAAVSSASAVNLAAGAAVVDSTGLVLTAGTAIETVYAGDGNDGLVGDSGGNTLFGGRGDDILFGGLGNDILDGGQNGLDAAYYLGRQAMYAVSETGGVATLTGPEGTDVLHNIDTVVFADGAVSLSALLQTSAIAGALAS